MEELKLRKFKINDIDNLMNLFNNKEILLNLRAKKLKISRKSEIEWLKKTIKEYKKKNPKSYDLVVLKNNELIGAVGIHKIDHIHNNAEIGYWISKKYWGKGYASKALNLFLNEINKKFKLIRITGYAFEYNKGSQRVLEKNGFKFETKRRKTTKRGKKYIDDYQYALIK